MIDEQEEDFDLNEDMAAEWAAMIDDEPEEDKSDMNSLMGFEVLSQEGIDTLLGYKFEPKAISNAKGIRLLANSDVVSNQRMPVLEIILDRLVRLMTTSLRNFTSDSVEVSLESVETVRLGDYLSDICLPSVISIFKAEEWDHYGLFSLDSELMYSMVDVLLGGRKVKSPSFRELRPYTSIEMALAERMTEIVLEDIENAFQPVADVSMNFVRMESDPRFATIGRPTDSGIIASFRVDMEGRGGYMDMLIPHAMLDPVRNALSQMFIGEGTNNDNLWEKHLTQEIYESNIELKAVLSEQWINLKDILSLQVGDTIDLVVKPEESVELRCGSAVIGDGDVGQKGKSLAIAMRSKNQLSAQEILNAQQA